MKTIELNETWINGKYANGEINTGLSYIDVPEVGEGWFLQGEDADNAIKEIHQYWLKNDVTTEQAFDWWINCYLY